MTLDHAWHVQDNGSQFGPVSHASLVARYRSGEITSQALIWRVGERSWQPIHAVLGNRTEHLPYGGQDYVELIHPRPGVYSQQPVISRGTRNLSIVLAVLFFGASTYASSILLTLKQYTAGFSEVSQFNEFYAVVWFGLLFSAAIATVSTIHFALGPSRRRTPVGRAILAIGIVLGVTFSVVIFTFGSLFSSAQGVFIASSALRDYRIYVDAFTLEIVINGSIGPGFAMKLEEKISQFPGAKTINITSPGGLVDEALTAADVIQRSGIPVYTKHYCHSACIILFAGGKERWADHSAIFGFHAVYPVTQDRYTTATANDFAVRAEKYLERRGIPTSILEASRSIGKNDLLRIGPAELRRGGFNIEVFELSN